MFVVEFVFKPSRRFRGKRLVSRVYSGKYSLTRGGKIFVVSLDTPDKRVAEKRLRDVIVEKQREQEGLIAPRSQRNAAAETLVNLLALYRQDLNAQGLDDIHVHDTCARLTRIFREAKWNRLGDVRPESFLSFRASLSCSAKTKKEYQTSANAFLNWLVKSDRLASNPLAKIAHVEIRGKSVRQSRAFTVAELLALFSAVAGMSREIFYRALLYTGQRYSEVAALTWGDFIAYGTAYVLSFQDSTTKDKEKRSIPVHGKLAAMLLDTRPIHAQSTDRIFLSVPSYERLRADLVAAKIQHRDSAGRVVHFHAFRKTFQTFGAIAGINQRSAQALLGHSDPALTANVYTDVNALQLHDEVAKLPWIDSTQPHSQNGPQNVCVSPIGQLISDLIAVAKRLGSVPLSELSQTVKLGAGAGFEPAYILTLLAEAELTCQWAGEQCAQLHAHVKAQEALIAS